MLRQTIVHLAGALLLCGAAPDLAAVPGPPYQGRRLVEVLSELRDQGLQLVWSSAVVGEELTVADEPATRDPREVLDAVLAPHGLVGVDAPGGVVAVVRSAERAQARPTGSIGGIVTPRGGSRAVEEVTVTVVGTEISIRAAADGSFRLREVPVGIYTVEARVPGLSPLRLEGVLVEADRETSIRFDLAPATVFLDEVVVTPSQFRILENNPENRHFLSRQEVEQMPHAADDLYRAVKRLPGAAGGDYSAGFNVRGGEQEELLVLLDGVELYEPFHLKDFQSIFSIIDSAAVGGVDFLTGGYPAEYGDRMSGVVDISPAVPTGPAATTVSLSTLNARLMSAGSWDEDRGRWLVSLRAWYPDDVLARVSPSSDQVVTDYYDLFAKVEHRLGTRSTLSGDLLVAFDDLAFHSADEEETEDVQARYGSFHAWSNLDTTWSSRLDSRAVLSAGRLTRDREGSVNDVVEGTLAVDDARTFDFLDLRQAWTLETGPRHLLKWGFEATAQEAVYDYLRVESDPEDPGEPTVVEVALEPDGSSFGVYVADRFQPLAPLVVELGLRWDDQSWIDESQFSPRVNLVLAAGPQTTVRAAWGRFHQSQRLNELQVEDGVTEYFPSQRAEHWLASVEHNFRGRLQARFELYQKDLSNLRPRYENQFSGLELFPEAQDDRIMVDPDRGRARGFELLIKHDRGQRLSWWLSYALAVAEDEIDGDWQFRNWDQRNAASFGVNLQLPGRWNVNLAGTYHSGWPTTEVTAVLIENEDGELVPEPVLGPRNEARFPAYHRLDVRATKRFEVGHGELGLVIEVLNLLDTRNVCCVDDFEFVVGDDGSVVVDPQYQYWAPIIPSVGIQYQF
jgi:outer membrane receptor protein involved in Fe transport